MGQVEDLFGMTNREAADILQLILHHTFIRAGRGNGKTMMALRQQQALIKAVDLLLKTPEESKAEYPKDGYVKLCPKCDGKDFHPVRVLNHFCPKCMRTWNECDDE